MNQKGFAPILMLVFLAAIVLGIVFIAKNPARLVPQPTIPAGETENNIKTSSEEKIAEDDCYQFAEYCIEPNEGVSGFITPYISHGADGELIRLSFNLNVGKTARKDQYPWAWDYDDWRFPVTNDGTVYYYSVSFKNKDNPEYGLLFYQMDTSFNYCDFDNSLSEGFQQDINLYREFRTNFGLLRIGTDKESNIWVVCQDGGSKADPGTWVSVTDIGFIDMRTPKEYKHETVDEMIQLLQKVGVTKYAKVN